MRSSRTKCLGMKMHESRPLPRERAVVRALVEKSDLNSCGKMFLAIGVTGVRPFRSILFPHDVLAEGVTHPCARAYPWCKRRQWRRGLEPEGMSYAQIAWPHAARTRSDASRALSGAGLLPHCS